MNAWKRKVEALARLAEDQRGKPEGELARQKMLGILAKYPEARAYEPARQFMASDLLWMKRHNVNIEGHWEGATLTDAIKVMTADYRRRMEEAKEREWLRGFIAIDPSTCKKLIIVTSAGAEVIERDSTRP